MPLIRSTKMREEPMREWDMSSDLLLHRQRHMSTSSLPSRSGRQQRIDHEDGQLTAGGAGVRLYHENQIYSNDKAPLETSEAFQSRFLERPSHQSLSSRRGAWITAMHEEIAQRQLLTTSALSRQRDLFAPTSVLAPPSTQNHGGVRFPLDHGRFDRPGETLEDETLAQSGELGAARGGTSRNLKFKEMPLGLASVIEEEELRLVRELEMIRRRKAFISMDHFYRRQRETELQDLQRQVVCASSSLEERSDVPHHGRAIYELGESVAIEDRETQRSWTRMMQERLRAVDPLFHSLSRRTDSSSKLSNSHLSNSPPSIRPARSLVCRDGDTTEGEEGRLKCSDGMCLSSSDKHTERRLSSSHRQEDEIRSEWELASRVEELLRSREKGTPRDARHSLLLGTGKAIWDRELLQQLEEREFLRHCNNDYNDLPRHFQLPRWSRGIDPSDISLVHRLSQSTSKDSSKPEHGVAAKGATSLPYEGRLDQSSELPPDDLSELRKTLSCLIERYSNGGTKEAPFPLKLHAILCNPAYFDIISWLPDGKSWKIFRVKLLEEVVLPRHFRHAQYASFMRQVNGWGFQRQIYRGQGDKGYSHPLFVREDPEKCLTMMRSGAKKNAAGERLITTGKREGMIHNSADSELSEGGSTEPGSRHSKAEPVGSVTSRRNVENDSHCSSPGEGKNRGTKESIMPCAKKPRKKKPSIHVKKRFRNRRDNSDFDGDATPKDSAVSRMYDEYSDEEYNEEESSFAPSSSVSSSSSLDEEGVKTPAKKRLRG